MDTTPMRIFLGFVAGAIAVLTFHQGTVELLHVFGVASHTAFRVAPTPPFGVPMVLSLTFWGGLYGAAFGAAQPWLRAPLWVGGLGLGCVAALVALFVAAPLKGYPIAYDWAMEPMLRTFAATGAWGLGVGLILPRLRPRPLRSLAFTPAT